MYLNFIKINFKKILSLKPFVAKSSFFIKSLFMLVYIKGNKGLHKIEKVKNTIVYCLTKPGR